MPSPEGIREWDTPKGALDPVPLDAEPALLRDPSEFAKLSKQVLIS